MVINKDNISDFYMDKKQRRMIRKGHVSTLKSLLKNGEHFSAPFVVNQLDDYKRMVDGNHREEAIEEILLENADFEIEVWVAVYKDLTIEQEREVYSDWNLAVKQTSTDFLKSYWETIPLRKSLLSRLPVSIYAGKTSLPIKSFVGNQIIAKREREHFEGGYSGGTLQVLEDFRNLQSEDIDLLEEFAEILENSIGTYQSKAPYYTGTSVSALYRIWYDNRDKYSKKDMIKHFSKVLDFKDLLLQDSSKAGGRNATLNFYNILLNRLNRGRVKFLSDVEIYEIRKKEVEEQQKMQVILKAV